MIAVTTLLVALTLTLIVTLIATVALTLTGLSKQSARFQARSALTGVGFTTSESESIMGHPVRRRIVMMLMLVGNAGIVTVIASLVASLAKAPQASYWDTARNLSLLAAGVTVLAFIANSGWIDRRMTRFIEWAARKWTRVDVCDYAALFRLANGFAISEMLVEEDDWIADKTLIELNLPAEGVLVLGIQREGGHYFGAPTGSTQVRAGDTLILYGLIERLDELDRRKADRAGAEARRTAVMEQKQVIEEQAQQDEASLEEREQEVQQDEKETVP